MTTDRISQSGSSASGSARPDSQSEAASGAWQDVRAKAGEAVSKFAEVAQQAGSQAKQTASSLASEANQKAKGLLGQQVAAGADLAGHVAGSVRRAADDLAPQAPQLADLVRGAADRVDQFSRDIRGQSVDELIGNASEFTRRNPALVFGLASVAGFLLLRVLKASSANGSPASGERDQFGSPSQAQRSAFRPQEERFTDRAGQFHGA